MTPEIQQAVDVLKQAQQASWIPSGIFYAVMGVMVSAVGALFAYSKILHGKVNDAFSQTISSNKAHITALEVQMKELTDAKNFAAAETLLKARIDAQERQLDAARDGQVEATEKRFRDLLDQNVKVVTAIHESTDAVKAAVQCDVQVAEALRALDINIEKCLRIQEDLRRKLDSMYCSKESKGK